ncbi:S41 family peptidase [Liberiplasma polymorphum]|uniref:S41 family peptidase n=1 Tax=Liberiplasma polymorphum TaxID=3374570 RepID=UPI003774B777
MKKILLLVVSLTLVFTLIACNRDVEPEDRSLETLENWVAGFTLPTQISDLETLPSNYEEASITWVSSEESVIENTGVINYPRTYEGSVDVNLTATFTYNEHVLTKDFTVTVEVKPLVTNIREIPFENLANEYIVEAGELEIFYLNNEAIPYVNIESFIQLLAGAIVVDELDILVEDNVVTIVYEGTYEDEDDPENNEDYYYILTADFNHNTVTVNRFGFFSAISESTQTDFGMNLYTIDYIYNATDPVVFELSNYGMELVREYDDYLMPFHLANLFFTGSMFDVYYNHDKIYGIDTYQIYSSNNTSVVNKLQNSALNTEDIPMELKELTYNYLAFTFDHFFGIKIATDIESYYDVLEPNRDDYLGTNKQHYEQIGRFTNRLDDLHTSHIMSGYYNLSGVIVPSLSFATMGPRTRDFYNAYTLLGSGNCSFQTGRVRYFEDQGIAVVTVSGFTTATPDAFKNALIAIEEKGTIDTVVIDLSCNTGGIIGTMLQTIGFMTDEPIAYHSLNAGDASSSSTYIGTENEAFDFEWYVLVSPVTYSAGNLMTSIVKDMGIATVIGNQPSGGASSITTNILPSGAIIIMSSPLVLANQSYESIEFGVPVDIQMDNADINNHLTVVNRIVQNQG